MQIGYRTGTGWRTGNYNIPGTDFSPFNQDHLFYASSANAGQGRWYMARRGPTADGVWHLYYWDGTLPTLDGSENWIPLPSNFVSNKIHSGGAEEMLGEKATHRLLLQWDNNNNILHVGQIHLGAQASDVGVMYGYYTMTASSSVGTEDEWTGGGAVKQILHPNFVNVHSGAEPVGGNDDNDMTSDTHWPIQADRLSMALEPAHTSTTKPRVWVSFMYSDGTNIDVYGNCSSKDSYTTWVNNTGDSTIGNYLKLVDDTSYDVKAGGGTENEMLNNDSQAKLYSGKTSGTPHIGLLYAHGTTWKTIVRSTAADPTAGGEGFGGAASVVTESDGQSHQMNVTSYFPSGSNSSILLFSAGTAKHNLRYGVRIAGTWTTYHLVEDTNYGYPIMVGDPESNNIFLFAANHGDATITDNTVLDYQNFDVTSPNPCRSIDMKVIDSTDLGKEVRAWQSVIVRGNTNTDYIAPMPVVSRSTPKDNAGGADGANPYFYTSKIMVASLVREDDTYGVWLKAMNSSQSINHNVVWNYIDPSSISAEVSDDVINNIYITSPAVGTTISVGDTLTITWDTE